MEMIDIDFNEHLPCRNSNGVLLAISKLANMEYLALKAKYKDNIPPTYLLECIILQQDLDGIFRLGDKKMTIKASELTFQWTKIIE